MPPRKPPNLQIWGKLKKRGFINQIFHVTQPERNFVALICQTSVSVARVRFGQHGSVPNTRVSDSYVRVKARTVFW